jgi:hypothetical protein
MHQLRNENGAALHTKQVADQRLVISADEKFTIQKASDLRLLSSNHSF